METMNYLRILVEGIHSTIVATLDEGSHPITRCIDMMLYDEKGIYFLTAKGKNFCHQLMEQKYISLSGIKGQRCVSFSGKVRNIGREKLEEIFLKNAYMQKIYPEGTREPLEVFQIYEGQGNFFDLSDPSHIQRGTFSLGEAKKESGYFVTEKCIDCQKCLSLCPQKCIQMVDRKALIEQNRRLHCGARFSICPVKAIVHR